MAERYFSGKNILIVSPEGWDHLFVSKHHYAIELSKRNNVFFLNPPSEKFSITKAEYENLWVISYTPFPKGLRFLPRFVQLYFMNKKFRQIQKLSSSQFDCVWSFDNSVFFDFSFLPKHVLKISHIVDYAQNFQLSRAASSANVCFGVTQNIVDRLLLSNRNSFLIPHGISINSEENVNVKLPGSNQVKTAYAGNLDSKYLDKQLLFSLIDSYPQVDFIFLGSGGVDWPRRANTFFLGMIKNEQLISYLKKADMLLLVYNVEKYPDQLTNAHKILDYLCSGKVIVSTFISDYAGSPRLLEMTKTKEEMFVLFGNVASNLSLYNNEENRIARIKHAESNTYAARMKEIEQIIDKVLSFRLTQAQ